jgi:hypothetical protein
MQTLNLRQRGQEEASKKRSPEIKNGHRDWDRL